MKSQDEMLKEIMVNLLNNNYTYPYLVKINKTYTLNPNYEFAYKEFNKMETKIIENNLKNYYEDAYRSSIHYINGSIKILDPIYIPICIILRAIIKNKL